MGDQGERRFGGGDHVVAHGRIDVLHVHGEGATLDGDDAGGVQAGGGSGSSRGRRRRGRLRGQRW